MTVTTTAAVPHEDHRSSEDTGSHKSPTELAWKALPLVSLLPGLRAGPIRVLPGYCCAQKGLANFGSLRNTLSVRVFKKLKRSILSCADRFSLRTVPSELRRSGSRSGLSCTPEL